MFEKSKLSYWVMSIGILSIIVGISQLSYLEAALMGETVVTGTLSSCDVYHNKEIKHKKGYSAEEVVVTDMIFYLAQHNKKYTLTKSLAVHVPMAYNQFNNELLALRRADTIKVWIPKNENDIYEPTILKIEADGHIIISNEQSANDIAKSTIPLAVIGVVLLLLGISFRKNKKNPQLS